MFDRGFSVDEIPIVFWIEDFLVYVFAGERHDRLSVIPQADSQEFGAVAVGTADEIRSLIALCFFVRGNTGAEDVLGVRVGVLDTGPASPDSQDQGDLQVDSGQAR